ncbi:MAG: NifU family protein, partial [Myxococcota bacterium]|nr:NifU family protein [Myxococcota bacterium]
PPPPASTAPTPAPPAPAPASTAPAAPAPDAPPPVSDAAPASEAVDAADGTEDAPAKGAPTEAGATAEDVVGDAITMEAVQELLDDMVRPALQADGGDITLIKVEDDNIYVKLVGACSTCPSSIATMKGGVELLLKEEFPTLKDVVQVDA